MRYRSTADSCERVYHARKMLSGGRGGLHHHGAAQRLYRRARPISHSVRAVLHAFVAELATHSLLSLRSTGNNHVRVFLGAGVQGRSPHATITVNDIARLLAAAMDVEPRQATMQRACPRLGRSERSFMRVSSFGGTGIISTGRHPNRGGRGIEADSLRRGQHSKKLHCDSTTIVADVS